VAIALGSRIDAGFENRARPFVELQEVAVHNWDIVLAEVIGAAYDAMRRSRCDWALIGSAATAVQGCPVVPRDLDFLTAEPRGVYHFAETLQPWAPSGESAPAAGEEWYSTAEQPVHSALDPYGFHWHFGRWLIEGLKVEVAHLEAPAGFPLSPSGAGIWEAGPEIWPHIKSVSFAGFPLPVVPLEIQLQTAIQRGLDERIAAIVAFLHQHGADHKLLGQSLAADHRESTLAMITGRVTA
jgi:hypothetical protein